MIVKKCPLCQGKRLKPEVLAVTVADLSIDKIVEFPIEKAQEFFVNLIKSQKSKLKTNELKIAQPIIKEIINRLQFLIDVGVGYLTLDRKAATLAGGEEQRIRLATQIGSKLTGVLYILDEPSIGLHARDQKRLIETLKKLRDLGNSVLVVEHDPQTIKSADWIIDLGPGAGKEGGRVIFQGKVKELLKAKTLTGEYLSERKKVEIEKKKEGKEKGFLIIKGAREHNLKNIDVKIPLGKFVCLTGVSGAGKSSLMNDILAKALLRKFYNSKEEPGEHKEILGTENLKKLFWLINRQLAELPDQIPPPIVELFPLLEIFFPKPEKLELEVTNLADFLLMLREEGARPVKVRVKRKLKCIFCPPSMFNVQNVKEQDIIKKL
jgi:excinuclease ABC subunit A